jgi:hypothetical protein
MINYKDLFLKLDVLKFEKWQLEERISQESDDLLIDELKEHLYLVETDLKLVDRTILCYH